jgi:hypothetical protein
MPGDETVVEAMVEKGREHGGKYWTAHDKDPQFKFKKGRKEW